MRADAARRDDDLLDALRSLRFLRPERPRRHSIIQVCHHDILLPDVIQLAIGSSLLTVEIEMAGAAVQKRQAEHLKEMWRQYKVIDAAQAPSNAGTDADFALHRARIRQPYFLRFVDFMGARIIPPRSIVVEKSA